MAYQLRIPHIDVQKAQATLRFRQQQIIRLLGFLNADPTKLRQRRLIGLATALADVGLIRYAFGDDLADVRKALAEALFYRIASYECRGTQPAFPVVEVVVDPETVETGVDPTVLIQRPPLGGLDYSETNSREAAWYVCLGLAIGEAEAAKRLAAMIWDPPQANYISANSDVCTPDDQAFAYALRELVGGDEREVTKSTRKVSVRVDERVSLYARLLEAVVNRNRITFLQTLAQSLQAHEAWARRDRLNPTGHIAVIPLGLLHIAIDYGVLLNGDILPSPYLPLRF